MAKGAVLSNSSYVLLHTAQRPLNGSRAAPCSPHLRTRSSLPHTVKCRLMLPHSQQTCPRRRLCRPCHQQSMSLHVTKVASSHRPDGPAHAWWFTWHFGVLISLLADYSPARHRAQALPPLGSSTGRVPGGQSSISASWHSAPFDTVPSIAHTAGSASLPIMAVMLLSTADNCRRAGEGLAALQGSPCQ